MMGESKRSIAVASHQHKTFDIKPLGACRACDDFHERQGVTVDEVEKALITAPALGVLRLLVMLRKLDPAKHAECLEWIGGGLDLAAAVDDAMDSSSDRPSS